SPRRDSGLCPPPRWRRLIDLASRCWPAPPRPSPPLCQRIPPRFTTAWVGLTKRFGMAGICSGIRGASTGGGRGGATSRRSGAAWLDLDVRSMPLLAHADRGYIVVAGGWLIQGKRVSFATDQDSQRVMTIEGYDPVRWLTGP